MDDDEAVTELMTARVLSFESQGYVGNLYSGTVAFRHLRRLGVRALPLLAAVLENGTPAGRAYAATLIGRVDARAGRAVWERLAGEPGRIRWSVGCVTYEPSLGEYARCSLEGRHPGRTNCESPRPDLSTFTIDRLERYLATLVDGRELDRARQAVHLRACRPGESGEVSRRWAKLAAAADVRLPGDNPWDVDRRAQLSFSLRLWIIEQLGPDGDPDWEPEALAADTLAVLTLDADQAVAMAANRRDLRREQIHDLHRHRDLTGHVDRLVAHLPAGPARQSLLGWAGFADLLR